MNEIAKRPWKAVMLLLAVFVAGGLVGGALAEWEPWEHDHRRDANGMVAHLTEELELTQAQADSITAVLDRWRPTMDSAWAEVRPRIETVRAQIRSDIAAQLTPDQQAKYEEMMKRHREPPKGPKPPPRTN
jgi:Spy/CpxP family protein refolding chaperone